MVTGAATGPRASRPRAWPLATVLAIVALLIALDAWWLVHFRRGYPLLTDEAAYIGISFNYVEGWRATHLHGLWSAYAAQQLHAPLIPLLTAPIMLVAPGILPAFAVQLAFFGLLVVATYGVAAHVAGPWPGVLAAGVVAALPCVTDYTRVFIFAMPASALLMAALYALLRSDGLRDRRWALAFGILVLLLPMTRTMMVVFLPGVLVAAGLQIAARPKPRRAALVNLGIGLAAGSAVALSWYGHSASTVLGYLGSAPAASGPTYDLAAARFWAESVIAFFDRYLYLPSALLVAVALTCGTFLAIRRLRALPGIRERAASLVSSGELILALVVAEGWLAVVSTGAGRGFGVQLPLVAPLVVLAVCALFALPSTRLRRALVLALIATSVFNVVAKANVLPAMSAVTSPWPRTPVIAGDYSFLRIYVKRAGQPTGSATHRLPAQNREWPTIERRVATFLVEHAAAHERVPLVTWTTTDPLFTSNGVQLASHLHLNRGIDIRQLTARRGDTEAAYRAILSEPSRNLVVLNQPGPGRFDNSVTVATAQRAAVTAGFRRVLSLRLPDRRWASVMWRDTGVRAIG